MIAFQSSHAGHVHDLCSLLSGDPSPWESVENWTNLFDAANYHGVSLLIFHLWRTKEKSEGKWPREIFDAMEKDYFKAAAEEILRRAELKRLSQKLNESEVPFAFIKGAATAYSVYPFAFLRSRVDTDLICHSSSRPRLEKALSELGYQEILTSNSNLLFGQSAFEFVDASRVAHCLDVHWEISARKLLAKLLPLGDILARRVALPAVSPFAWRPSDVHTLLLSCTHAVAHHANDLRLIWLYESAQLSKRFDDGQWKNLLQETYRRNLKSPVAEVLENSHSHFPGNIPNWALTELRQNVNQAETKEKWRTRQRGRSHDLIWDLKHLEMRKKTQLLMEVLFPRSDYLFARWGRKPGFFGKTWLPYLYFRRIASAVFRKIWV